MQRREVQAAGPRQGLLPQALHGLAPRRAWATIIATRSAPRKAAGSRARRRPVRRARRQRRAAPRPRRAPERGSRVRRRARVDRCRRLSSAAARACTARCASRARRTPRCRSSPRRCWRSGRSTFRNVPALGDVRTMAQAARAMLGAERRRDKPARTSCASTPTTITELEAPYELVKTMRASVLVLGPAGRALRAGARVAARRLRHRRAADRSAPQGPGGDGREDHARARLRRRAQRQAAARRDASCSTCRP